MAIAERVDELLASMEAFGRDELSLDQMATIPRNAPVWIDVQSRDEAIRMTLTQVRHVLRTYLFPALDDAGCEITEAEVADATGWNMPDTIGPYVTCDATVSLVFADMHAPTIWLRIRAAAHVLWPGRPVALVPVWRALLSKARPLSSQSSEPQSSVDTSQLYLGREHGEFLAFGDFVLQVRGS